MIKINTMYEFYTEDLNLKIKKLEEEKAKYSSSIRSLTSTLEDNKDYINAYCNVKLDTILKTTTSSKILKTLRFPPYTIYSNGRRINTQALKMYITRYILVNASVTAINININRHQKELISFELYKNTVSYTHLTLPTILRV
jgi:hypothetical protein